MPEQTATRHQRRRMLCALASAAALGAGFAVWAGCSVEKHYKTLSFFFDGVPDPEARKRAVAAGGVMPDMRESPTYSAHKPYLENKCDQCHTDKFKIGSLDSTMCLNCHKEVPSEHARMHGPVAAGACLWCHAPHESAEAHLLKRTARLVCAQCHDKSLLTVDRVPAHADDSRSCLECHSGHGGKAPYFLREGVSRLAPERTPPGEPNPQPAPPSK